VEGLDHSRGRSLALAALLLALLGVLFQEPRDILFVAARPSYARQNHLLIESGLALLTGPP
jgi:hypothetical protein